MFCRRELNGSYTPIYIGQAASLKDRPPLHEQWNPAVRKGADSVHVALVPSQADRDFFEVHLNLAYTQSQILVSMPFPDLFAYHLKDYRPTTVEACVKTLDLPSDPRLLNQKTQKSAKRQPPPSAD